MAQVLYPYSPLLTYYRPDIDKETPIVDMELEIVCPICIAYIIFLSFIHECYLEIFTHSTVTENNVSNFKHSETKQNLCRNSYYCI